MRKGIMTFEKVMKDRKRAERVKRKNAQTSSKKFKWVEAPAKVSRLKKAWNGIKKLVNK